MKPALLSPHLSVVEYLSTSHRDLLDEQERYWLANEQIRSNALRFARDVFEPVRAIVGPLLVSSGLRCPALNKTVGGARASRHIVGLACDVVPTKVGVVEAMGELRELLRSGRLPGVDRIIFEWGRWLHLQAPLAEEKPKHLALMTFGDGYPDFDAADPRVIARRMT